MSDDFSAAIDRADAARKAAELAGEDRNFAAIQLAKHISDLWALGRWQAGASDDVLHAQIQLFNESFTEYLNARSDWRERVLDLQRFPEYRTPEDLATSRHASASPRDDAGTL